MNTKSIRILKNKRVAWLLPLLLLGASTPQLVQAAQPPVLVAAINVDIILRPPPPPRVEVINERRRPSRDHVWVAGYWGSRRGRQEWVPGRWERPPHGRTVWIAPRWEQRGRGYVFIEGSWAESRRDDRRDDHRNDRHDDRHDDRNDHR